MTDQREIWRLYKPIGCSYEDGPYSGVSLVEDQQGLRISMSGSNGRFLNVNYKADSVIAYKKFDESYSFTRSVMLETTGSPIYEVFGSIFLNEMHLRSDKIYADQNYICLAFSNEDEIIEVISDSYPTIAS